MKIYKDRRREIKLAIKINGEYEQNSAVKMNR